MKVVVMGAGDPGWHWGACSTEWGRDSTRVPSHTLPTPSRLPQGRAFQPAAPASKLHLCPGLSRVSQGLALRRDSVSPRSPQPLVCLLRQSRGHVFANFVAAFIKWGFTGALSPISGLVGAINKTESDSGAAQEKVFVLQRMSCVPCPVQVRRAGRPVAGGPRGSSWPGEP